MAKLLISFIPWAVYWAFAVPCQYKLGGFLAVSIAIFLNLRHANNPKLLEVVTTPFFFIAMLIFNYADLELHLSFVWLAGVALIPLALGKVTFIQQYFAEEGVPPLRKYNLLSALWGGVFLATAVGSWYGNYLIPAGLAILAAVFSALYGKRAGMVENAEG
ncbi:MAG: hypothetical protein HZA04_04255 [Nitrospinae bacterium]|nr:hypothetical protein [Nitrospinota bacterium]